MKGVAELSEKLLARKGEALPASRHGETSVPHGDFTHPPRPAPRFGRRGLGTDGGEMRRGEGNQAPHGAREMPARDSHKSQGKRYAFTLRLDPERHRRLRLLSAKTDRSAQALLIDALDDVLQQYEQSGTGCACMQRAHNDDPQPPAVSADGTSTEQGQ